MPQAGRLLAAARRIAEGWAWMVVLALAPALALAQEPLYFTQGNLGYNFAGGVWAALGASYYPGGWTTVGGVRKDDKLGKSLTGLILAFPVNRQHSIKLNASQGLHTRTGTDFKTVGVAWQYRWGAGF